MWRWIHMLNSFRPGNSPYNGMEQSRRRWLHNLLVTLPQQRVGLDRCRHSFHPPNHHHHHLLLPHGLEDIQGQVGQDRRAQGNLLHVSLDNCYLSPLLVASKHLLECQVRSSMCMNHIYIYKICKICIFNQTCICIYIYICIIACICLVSAVVHVFLSGFLFLSAFFTFIFLPVSVSVFVFLFLYLCFYFYICVFICFLYIFENWFPNIKGGRRTLTQGGSTGVSSTASPTQSCTCASIGPSGLKLEIFSIVVTKFDWI